MGYVDAGGIADTREQQMDRTEEKGMRSGILCCLDGRRWWGHVSLYRLRDGAGRLDEPDMYRSGYDDHVDCFWVLDRYYQGMKRVELVRNQSALPYDIAVPIQ